MDFIVKINDFINGIVWGIPLMILIVATGIFFSIRLGFLQFTRPRFILRETIGKAFRKKDETKTPGELTSFQAAMISVSAIVGSGNIAGVATAIVLGGPGALFWMIIAALIGGASKFAEIALGIKYREINSDGSIRGGAMYYIEKGLKQKWLSIVFSLLVIPFSFVISGIVDSNTISLTFYDNFGISTVTTGFVLATVTAIIIFGGLKRIGYACAVIAPFMGIAYLLAGFATIVTHIEQVPSALLLILKSAFNPSAISGGTVGSILVCMKYGIARGVYSNEAGLGTAAMVHCGAKVKHPIEQAMWGPVETFLDTIVVCTVSALAIVLSGLYTSGLDGATLTVAAFDKLLPYGIGKTIVLGSVLLFGFSCIISYYNYAEQAVTHLTGLRNKNLLKVCWIVAVFIGSQTTLGFVWDLADTFNGLMIIPNLIALLFLSKEVINLKDEYFRAITGKDGKK